MVTLGANLEIRTGACTFDLGGRHLSIQKSLQMTGSGSVSVKNAASITIGSAGKIKSRGDFVQPQGFIIRGGLISLETIGSIGAGGQLDVSGDPAGRIRLTAIGPIVINNTASLQANGITSFTQDSQRFADGGQLEILSSAGAVTVAGDVSLNGAQGGEGGLAFFQAAQTLRIDRPVDASGGSSDGGAIGALAGDDIVITRALSAESRGGGGFGGTIFLEAGADQLGGVVTGGSLIIDNAMLQLSGSSAGGVGGDGGDLDAAAYGSLQIVGPYAGVRANAGATYSGFGGSISLEAQHGDLTLDGTVVAQSGSAGGDGGSIRLSAGRQLTTTANVDVSGAGQGGDVQATSGGSFLVAGPINAQARGASGAPGFVDLGAGFAQDANLTVERDILAAGGASSPGGQAITLRGCGLTVRSGTKIDGHAGSNGGVGGGSDILLIARRPIALEATSQFLAYPAGTIVTVHPPGQIPSVGAGTVFSPARMDVTDPDASYPACSPN
jgi:hypothetical protein